MPGSTFTMSPATPGSGLHHLTLAKMKSIIKQALGKTTFDSTFDTEEIANDSLQIFSSLHPWMWREAALSISTVADQSYALLPTDFAEMATDGHSNEDIIFGNMRKATLDDIVRFRQTTLSGIAASTRYAITCVGGDDDDDLPRYRMEFWPTPSSVFPITGKYRRILRRMTDDSDVPDVPIAYHQLLRRVLRAHAFEEDDQIQAAEAAWTRVNAMLSTAIVADGRTDAALGPMRGAVNSQQDVLRWTPQISLE
jgi:hypothetical protein